MRHAAAAALAAQFLQSLPYPPVSFRVYFTRGRKALACV